MYLLLNSHDKRNISKAITQLAFFLFIYVSFNSQRVKARVIQPINNAKRRAHSKGKHKKKINR